HRFQHWLRHSRPPKAPRKLRRIMARGYEAPPRPRLEADMLAYESDPRLWLRHGTVKETDLAPACNPPAKPIIYASGARTTKLVAGAVVVEGSQDPAACSGLVCIRASIPKPYCASSIFEPISSSSLLRSEISCPCRHLEARSRPSSRPSRMARSTPRPSNGS